MYLWRRTEALWNPDANVIVLGEGTADWECLPNPHPWSLRSAVIYFPMGIITQTQCIKIHPETLYLLGNYPPDESHHLLNFRGSHLVQCRDVTPSSASGAQEKETAIQNTCSSCPYQLHGIQYPIPFKEANQDSNCPWTQLSWSEGCCQPSLVPGIT